MKVAALFSGGKDSVFSAYKSKEMGYDLVGLITVISENTESYMFHTPSIKKTKKQAEAMKLPLISEETKGEKEIELEDLEKAIKRAKERWGVEGIVTGAIKSVYQASRIEKICNKLDLEFINPLWQKDEFNYLKELIKGGFKVVIIGVFAYPFDKSWLGREINEKFIQDIKPISEKYKVHPAGEGGEFETFVLDAPRDLFKKSLKIKDKKITSSGKYSWKMEIDVE